LKKGKKKRMEEGSKIKKKYSPQGGAQRGNPYTERGEYLNIGGKGIEIGDAFLKFGDKIKRGRKGG